MYTYDQTKPFDGLAILESIAKDATIYFANCGDNYKNLDAIYLGED